ncbi:DNA mismatch repair protein MutS [Clostridium felsineum]|uniref:DNA mismatch repair protein MutS n=1 Tax=Clostridium felsineum TaxID=36839 RepID=A0A1S8M8A4_9CLOT|nr:DNA mismatch repair protein MutS [Clostridium felsineum]URZ06682.1 DNA mismatch repair protein MutS [Clostridium felsineum]URZ11715.1 DNA mismatch repair protein MutS [Clostridium felsineum]
MGISPMMQQYLSIKENYKDCILFFRVGDFYEMFFEDAEMVSRELELVLTGKDCGIEKRAPMCGVPHHAYAIYASKLVSKGYKVAIAEQLEDPAASKGIVKRDVIKVLTPGTYTDSSFLEDTKNNYIMSLFINGQNLAMCFADISTGEFNCTEAELDLEILLNEISKFAPKEIVLQQSVSDKFIDKIKERFDIVYNRFEDDYFKEYRNENLKAQFSNYAEVNMTDILKNSANGLIKYIIDTQKTALTHIDELQRYEIVDFLSIDINSRRNLELTETLKDKSKKGSLLWVLDKTSTAMGGRQIRKWIERPLIDENKIKLRLDAVEEMLTKVSYNEDLKEALKQVYDIERLAGKISTKSVNAKEMISLRGSIEKLPTIKNIIKNFNSDLLINMENNLDDLSDIYSLLYESINDNPSLSIKEGNIIKTGYNKDIDDLRLAKSHGKQWIASLENSEREVTGIKSLKVSYNKVFGYYIEITKSNLGLVPEGRYIRKQTLANSERYITPELKEMEEKILGSEEKLVLLEYSVFSEIRERIEKEIDRIKSSAKILSELDCISSFADVARENNYCKPIIKNDGMLSIKGGRHPVVEKVIANGNFVANDTVINNSDNTMMLITGPNMAGKSTYMRQVGLIVLMAQIGCFVPASSAEISICDKIFTRIGASDDLNAGKSTFMVEMWEVSNILKNATQNSLILLDEVGRGTSTYDGLSIAWAVIEYICKSKELKCKTLFATHYHELTKLEGKIEGLKNYSIAVKKVNDDIIFLRKIVAKGADESYGIEVAKIAGLPEAVLVRAREILKDLEEEKSKTSEIKMEVNEEIKSVDKTEKVTKENNNDSYQIDFNYVEKENILSELKNTEIMEMNPIECMNKLYEFVKRAKKL